MSEHSGTRSLLPSFSFSGLHIATSSHGRDADRFSGAAVLTQILGSDGATGRPGDGANRLAEALASGRARNLSEAISQLNPADREALNRRWGRSLAEIESLSHERDAAVFYAGLLQIGQRLEDNDQLEQAGLVYSALAGGSAASVPATIAQRAQIRFNAMNGVGDGGERFAFLARRISTEATRPDMLIAMGAAGAAFRLTRLAATARFAGTIESGFGLRAAANASAFLVETAAFTGVGKVAGAAFGQPQDWSPEAWGHEWAAGATMLLGLKVVGAGVGHLSQRWATAETAFGRFTQAVAPQVGMFGGILAGNRLSEFAGFHPHRDGDTWFVDGLSTLLQFNVAGRLQAAALGPGFARFERRIDFHTEMLTREATARPGILDSLTAMVSPEFVTPEGIRISASSIENRPSEIANPLRPNAVFSVSLDGASSGGAASGSTASGEGSASSSSPAPSGGETSATPAAIVRRSSGSEAPRQIDPEQTLAMLPMGALTPHGNERSTYLRAVGDPAWMAEVGVMNGHLEYRGNGQYVDKATGEPITLDQIAERYGDAIRRGTGFRVLKSDLPIETPWAGQIPEGLRPEGEIPEAIFRNMGIGKKDFPYIRNNAQFAAQGLYALMRSAVQWGATLDELVGHDPRTLGISVSSGLGGMENLIQLILQSTQRRMRGETATTTTQPPTVPLLLPGLLIDSMQGLFTSVLGPKGDSLPEGLTPNTVIRTVGRVPVDVGACATGYKAFANAADMFRPGWPGQMRTELAIFGSSEAAHGMVNSRPETTGFNAMKAMDTAERLAKHLGINAAEFNAAMVEFQTLYSPLTTDVRGFWPSEGAGVGGMLRLSRAIALGLPIDALVTGYSVSGDQGAKTHPADLGLGGATALMESLRMSIEWQGMNPNRLRYKNMHGTGTPNNNEVEPHNLVRVLEAYGFDGQVFLSAYKALLGHGLGAAGAMEMAILMLSARHGVFPGAFNLEGREVDPKIRALGDRIVVSSDLVRDVEFFGGGSQGFAGNNAEANWRAITDQVLHEVYGYSIPEIEAYYSRLSGRRDQAHQWEEAIRTGGMSGGDFLRLFGLSDRAPIKPTTFDMGGSGGGSGGESAPPTPSVDPVASTEPMPTPVETVPADSGPRAVRVPLAELARLMEERDRPGADPAAFPQVVELMPELADPAAPDSMSIPAVLQEPGAEGGARTVVGHSMGDAFDRLIESGRFPQTQPPQPVSVDPEAPFPPPPGLPELRVSETVAIRERTPVPAAPADVTIPSPPPSGAPVEPAPETTTLPSPADPVSPAMPEGQSVAPPVEGEWNVEPEALHGKAAAFLRGRRVTPWQRLVGSVGEGEVLTTRGGRRATWSAAMRGIDDPVTLAYRAEEEGLTRYDGRDSSGTETWVRSTTGERMTPNEIAREFGDALLRNSGPREIPLEGDARNLPVRHGGMMPEALRGRDRVYERMGLSPESVAGTAFRNQFLEGKSSNLGNAGDMTAYGLYVALRAAMSFGQGLHNYFPSSRFGAASGSAFPDLGVWMTIYERAKAGRESNPIDLQSALPETTRGNFLNLMLPHAPAVDFKRPLEEVIQALLPILPTDGRMPNTGGVNLNFSAACASGLYALWGARKALIHEGTAGEYPMDAMMVIGADATFSPFNVAPAVPGFGRLAPATVTNMVERLERQGLWTEARRRLPDGKGGERKELAPELWERMPEELRRRAMSEASAPFTKWSEGLVVAEGAAALPWANFETQLRQGLWPTSLLLGLHLAAGEGGGPNLASMDQGIVTAIRVALRQANAHGVVPQYVQAHGTSTKLNNIAEYYSLYFALRAEGLDHPVAMGALKGLIAHTMGAASAIDMVMAVQTLINGEAPGLFNFRVEDMDERFASRAPHILEQLRFSAEPHRGGIESVLILSEGFLSANAAAVMGRFPQEVGAAKDMLRDYGVPEHIRSDWAVKAEENRARGREMEDSVRRGRMTHLEAFERLRFRP